jgi:hypothetical protein
VSCARCSLSSGAGATWHGPSERNLPIPKQRCTTLTLLVGLLSLLPWVATADDFTTARVAVYFSPSGGATDAVVRELNAATTEILVQADSFTSAPVAKAPHSTELCGGVMERVITHRKPPDVRMWRLSNQSCVGTFPPSTSTPHWPLCLARR